MPEKDRVRGWKSTEWMNPKAVEFAKKFSEEVFGVLFSVLLLLTIAMELAMPFVIRYAIAPGFAGCSNGSFAAALPASAETIGMNL